MATTSIGLKLLSDVLEIFVVIPPLIYDCAAALFFSKTQKRGHVPYWQFYCCPIIAVRTDSWHPWLKCYQLQFNFPIQGLLTKKTRLGMETSIPSWDFQYKKFHKYEVSCLFIKYLLTCGFVTIDGTEKLC